MPRLTADERHTRACREIAAAAVRKVREAIAAAAAAAAPQKTPETDVAPPPQETARERMLREQRAQLGKTTE
jgi:hypothetical protein